MATRRGVVIGAVVGLAIAASELLASLFWAPGLDAGHVRGHVATALIALVAGAALWLARGHRWFVVPITAVAMFVSVLALTFLLEGAAAFAYDADNHAIRFESLHQVHNAVTTTGPLAALLGALGGGVVTAAQFLRHRGVPRSALSEDR